MLARISQGLAAIDLAQRWRRRRSIPKMAANAESPSEKKGEFGKSVKLHQNREVLRHPSVDGLPWLALFFI